MFSFKKNCFSLNLFLAVLSVCCCLGFPLVGASGVCSPVAVCRLLIVGAPLVELGILGVRASELQLGGSVAVALERWSTGSIAVAHRLSCSEACVIFPDQGSNPCLLQWQADSSSLSLQGSPCLISPN